MHTPNIPVVEAAQSGMRLVRQALDRNNQKIEAVDFNALATSIKVGPYAVFPAHPLMVSSYIPVQEGYESDYEHVWNCTCGERLGVDHVVGSHFISYMYAGIDVVASTLVTMPGSDAA